MELKLHVENIRKNPLFDQKTQTPLVAPGVCPCCCECQPLAAQHGSQNLGRLSIALAVNLINLINLNNLVNLDERGVRLLSDMTTRLQSADS